MKLDKLFQNLLLTAAVVLLIGTPTKAEEVQEDDISRFSTQTIGKSRSKKKVPATDTDSKFSVSTPSVRKPRNFQSQAANDREALKWDYTSKRIFQLSEIEFPATSAQILVQTPTPTTPANPKQIEGDRVALITGVKANPTDKGVEVVLETTQGDKLKAVNRSTGNNFISDIIGGQLRLPSGDAFTFRSNKPIEGITEITVANIDTKTVRVIVVGEKSLPAVELFDDDDGRLIFAIASVTTVTQEPQSPETPQSPEQEKPTSETQPEKPTVQSDEPIELTVTAEQDPSLVPNIISGSRADTPVLDIPQSVQVIPREILKDQQVTDLQEALRNISGVSGDSDEGRGLEFNIRGFAGAPVLRDGFRTFGVNNNRDTQNQGFVDIANIESIEVLKGPSAILFGQIEPGGLINVVTKKPLEEPFYEAELQVGSRDFVRPRIDISGPLNSDKSILYRLNAVSLNDRGFRDSDTDIDRYFLAPSLTFKLGDRTDLNFQLEYLNDERPFDTGLVALGDKVADIPYDRNLNEPDDFIKKESLNVGYNLEHRFNKDWTLRNAFRYTKNDDSLETVLNFPFLGALDESTGELNRTLAIQDVNVENYSFQTNVIGNFNTGPIGHKILFGIDLARNETQQRSKNDFSNILPINIFDPVYRSFTRAGEEDLPTSQDIEITVNSLGIYLQDQISLTDNLLASVGIRYDTIEQETITNTTGSETTQNDDSFTPSFGIVYKPLQNLSLYASYARSFAPNAGVAVGDVPLEPETGEGYEIGAKAEFLEGILFATLAYFDITKNNVATTDPNNTLFSIATGEQRSRGVELDVIGKVLPGWKIIASYSYINAEITEDNNFSVGNKLPGVPQHSASLWTNYEIQQGDLQGLGFGIGFNLVGNREGDLDNSFELGSYFLTNAGISYRRDNWRIALNIKNLFDVDYITGTPINRTRGIQPGEPFTVIGSISIKF